MAHYTNPKRLWFTERGRIAFVEEATSSTVVDGVTTSIISISEAKSVRIKGIFNALHFLTQEPAGDDPEFTMAGEYDDPLAGPLEEIPNHFHEALVTKVIASGYKDPRHLEIQLAQYFDLEYNNMVKTAKKYARSNYLSTGTIVPQEF